MLDTLCVKSHFSLSLLNQNSSNDVSKKIMADNEFWNDYFWHLFCTFLALNNNRSKTGKSSKLKTSTKFGSSFLWKSTCSILSPTLISTLVLEKLLSITCMFPQYNMYVSPEIRIDHSSLLQQRQSVEISSIWDIF